MANKKFRVLGLDPGLTNCGWNLAEVNLKDDSITILKVGEFHPGPTVEKKNYRDEVEKFDKRTISLAYLREQLTKLLTELKPDAVCAEDIFINPHRPQAYGALSMFICVAKMTCYDVVHKHLVTIPTKICKQHIASRGDSSKLSVQQAIASSKHISFKDPVVLTQMTEHEADSIAVSNALVQCYHDLIEKYLEEQNG